MDHYDDMERRYKTRANGPAYKVYNYYYAIWKNPEAGCYEIKSRHEPPYVLMQFFPDNSVVVNPELTFRKNKGIESYERNAIRNLTGVEIYQGVSVQTNGRHAVSYRHYPTRAQFDIGGRFLVTPDYDIKILDVPKIRVHNKENQKKLRAALKELRYAFKVRARLGAFPTFDEARKFIIDGRVQKEGITIPREHGDILFGINISNIASFDTLLYHVAWCGVWNSAQSWEERFELYINKMREELRKEYESVVYLDPTEVNKDTTSVDKSLELFPPSSV